MTISWSLRGRRGVLGHFGEQDWTVAATMKERETVPREEGENRREQIETTMLEKEEV